MWRRGWEKEREMWVDKRVLYTLRWYLYISLWTEPKAMFRLRASRLCPETKRPQRDHRPRHRQWEREREREREIQTEREGGGKSGMERKATGSWNDSQNTVSDWRTFPKIIMCPNSYGEEYPSTLWHWLSVIIVRAVLCRAQLCVAGLWWGM